MLVLIFFFLVFSDEILMPGSSTNEHNLFFILLCCPGEVMLCCIWFGELFVRLYTSSLLGSYVHQTVILLNYVNDTNLLQWFSWKPESFYCINSCSYSSVLQSSFSQVAIHLTIISSSLLQLYNCLFVVLGKLFWR